MEVDLDEHVAEIEDERIGGSERHGVRRGRDGSGAFRRLPGTREDGRTERLDLRIRVVRARGALRGAADAVCDVAKRPIRLPRAPPGR
jgi:hypothetical protein